MLYEEMQATEQHDSMFILKLTYTKKKCPGIQLIFGNHKLCLTSYCSFIA